MSAAAAARTAPGAGEVHLINPMWNASGGSERRTLELFRELRPHAPVRIWSDRTPDPALAEFPIRRIEPRRFRFPRTGTFVFVGAYALPRKWYFLTWPRRVVLIYNVHHPDEFAAMLRRVSAGGARRVEVVYASEWMRDAAGLPGVVHASPVDLERFVPAEREGEGAFVVGRLSRDQPEKHHPSDPALYRRLAGLGCEVRVMGGTCLAGDGEATPAVRLLPAGSQAPEAFLRGLDAFLYRTGPGCVEAFGRVVVEAMACGLPVVCARGGGYGEVIEDGRSGFLFDTDAEAEAILLRLRGDPALRRSVGRAARARVEALYSPDRRRAHADFYLR